MSLIARLALFAFAGTRLHPGDDHAIRSWRLVNEHNWQIVSSTDGEASELTDAREGTRGACPSGMVAIDGVMKIDGSSSVDELQQTTCTVWLDRKFPERCSHFDRDMWLRLSRRFETKPMRFCIDRFEYPNELGSYPVIDVSWREAQALCAARHERLCTEDEWTFACEGPEAMPYPTGYERDANACVIDRPWRAVDERTLVPRESQRAMLELDRLWQGEASGACARCRSPFGVYDMTGNVDEWTVSSRGAHRPILKGGYWGRVRTRCRPSTRIHEESYSYYQQGFRCCASAP